MFLLTIVKKNFMREKTHLCKNRTIRWQEKEEENNLFKCHHIKYKYKAHALCLANFSTRVEVRQGRAVQRAICPGTNQVGTHRMLTEEQG
jgi:hypothetical protein